MENPSAGKTLRFGVVDSSYPTRDVVTLGILAERYSFDSVWIPDHFTDLFPLGDKVEPWTVLATIGAHTKKIRLGTVVMDTQRTHPSRIAHTVATVDELTDGRTMLGVGAGEAMNTTPYGLPFESVPDRVERLKESIEVIRLLWSSKRDRRVTFQGRFYSLQGAVMDQQPTSRPPIYVGALGSRSTLELTGAIGDGWIPWINSVDTFRRRSKIILDSATRAGREPGAVEMANVTSVALTEDPSLQRKVLDAMKVEMLITLHSSVLKEMGFVAPAEDIDYKYQRIIASESIGDRASEVAMGIPDDLVRNFLVMGSASEIIEGLARYAKAGVQHFVIKDIVGMSLMTKLKEAERTLRVFHEKVIPALR
jgi:phthiodiolone/phenolphthiodiolone dimycocerosates ketoreductase